MTDLLAVIPDGFIVVGTIVFAARCFTYSRSLKTGLDSRNFAIIGAASLLLFLAELGHLTSDAGIYPTGEFAHDVIEALFVIVLAVGVSRFYPSWMPKPES